MAEKKQYYKRDGSKDYPLLDKIASLPGGLVIVPLVIAVVLATFCPGVFKIGGYVTALFYEGNSCMMGFFLIVCGRLRFHDRHQAGRYAAV